MLLGACRVAHIHAVLDRHSCRQVDCHIRCFPALAKQMHQDLPDKQKLCAVFVGGDPLTDQPRESAFQNAMPDAISTALY